MGCSRVSIFTFLCRTLLSFEKTFQNEVGEVYINTLNHRVLPASVLQDGYFLKFAKFFAAYPFKTSIHSITAVTAEAAGNQISFYIIVINSPKEVNESFEQSNIYFEELL